MMPLLVYARHDLFTSLILTALTGPDSLPGNLLWQRLHDHLSHIPDTFRRLLHRRLHERMDSHQIWTTRHWNCCSALSYHHLRCYLSSPSFPGIGCVQFHQRLWQWSHRCLFLCLDRCHGESECSSRVSALDVQCWCIDCTACCDDYDHEI